MKYVKKKIFFLTLQKILENNTFVLFFQYTHLKNKEYTFFKKIFIEKNTIKNITLNKKNFHILSKNFYVLNNKILYKYFEKTKNIFFFSENKEKNSQNCSENFYLPKVFFNNFVFCAQGPTFCVFFNDVHTLQLFFNEIPIFSAKQKIENIHFHEKYIHKKNIQKNTIFLQKKKYIYKISQNLFFIGGIYKKSFVNIHTLQNIYTLHNNAYNSFMSFYFVYVYNFFNNVYYIKFKYVYIFIYFFYALYTYLYTCSIKNKKYL